MSFMHICQLYVSHAYFYNVIEGFTNTLLLSDLLYDYYISSKNNIARIMTYFGNKNCAI